MYCHTSILYLLLKIHTYKVIETIFKDIPVFLLLQKYCLRMLYIFMNFGLILCDRVIKRIGSKFSLF